MIVTTAGKGADQLHEKAIGFSQKLDCRFVLRNKQSVQELIEQYKEDVLVIGKQKITLHHACGGEPFFYHPNSAMFRVKQFLKTGYDPLIDTAKLTKGMTFLDCTLGLASDSLVAKLAVGKEGRVIGLEANATVAAIVKEGLQTWNEGGPEMLAAMKAIEVIHAKHYDYLLTLEDNSVDVVYFDPMFEQHLSDSTGIKGLKQFACHDDLSEETLREAYRVCSGRIVLKDHWKSTRFDRFPFHVMRRQHSAFHYGYIKKEGKCLNL